MRPTTPSQTPSVSSYPTPSRNSHFKRLKREALVDRIAAGIHEAPNRVRYCMNGFVIAVGAHVAPLSARARAAAAAYGKVRVDVGETACKVPDAVGAIDKVEARGSVGKKRKTVKC